MNKPQREGEKKESVNVVTNFPTIEQMMNNGIDSNKLDLKPTNNIVIPQREGEIEIMGA